MGARSVLLKGKGAYFPGILNFETPEEAVVDGPAGKKIAVLSEDPVILDSGGSVIINYGDVLREVVALSSVSGAVKIIDRGSPSGPDKSTGDFTKDGTWYDLDLSGIVGVGATWINIRVDALTAVAGGTFAMRKKGATTDYSGVVVKTHVAALGASASFILPCSASLVVQYLATNQVWTQLDLTVLGWLIPVA